jgi:hypothetical protein
LTGQFFREFFSCPDVQSYKRSKLTICCISLKSLISTEILKKNGVSFWHNCSSITIAHLSIAAEL